MLVISWVVIYYLIVVVMLIVVLFACFLLVCGLVVVSVCWLLLAVCDGLSVNSVAVSIFFICGCCIDV